MEAIQQKMAQFGTNNLSAYMRKMAVDGYVVQLDLPELKELVSLLRRSSNNLNPVSYTHLDVYKRQVLPHIKPHSRELINAAAVTLAKRIIPRCLLLSIPCLLYTSFHGKNKSLRFPSFSKIRSAFHICLRAFQGYCRSGFLSAILRISIYSCQARKLLKLCPVLSHCEICLLYTSRCV